MKTTLQKIIIIILSITSLTLLFVVPMSASILPSENSVYNNSIGYGDIKNLSASMIGANGYNSRYYSSSDFTHSNVSSMGTNDVYDVTKPTVMLPVTTIATNQITIFFDLAPSLFVNDYNYSPISGYYRLRFGIYLRAHGNNTGTIAFNSYATYFQGEQITNDSFINGVYIPTGSSVPGVYHYFDMTVRFDESMQNTTSISIEITPDSTNDWLRFSGSTPYYEKSFISITPIFAERSAGGNGFANAPYTSGTVLRYNTNTSLLLDSYSTVGTTFVNPFTGSNVEGGSKPMLLTHPSYPNLGYYYIPSDTYGYLYKVFLLTNEVTDNLNPSNPQLDYAEGYAEGYQSATDYYESIISDKDALYNQLKNSMGTQWEQAYDDGYAAGQTVILSDTTQFLWTIDRAGNLIRNVISPFLDIGIFGISISTIIFVGVTTLLVVVIIKKVR